MKESFSPKESKYCAKCCQDREVGQVSKKGGTGCVWREMGVFLEARKDPGKRRQNAFLNLQVLKSSELQTSVSEDIKIASSLSICYCSGLLASLSGNCC